MEFWTERGALVWVIDRVYLYMHGEETCKTQRCEATTRSSQYCWDTALKLELELSRIDSTSFCGLQCSI